MIADTIKNLRRKNFLSQTAFAKKIGVTQGSVSQWENGLTSPNSEQLRSIASIGVQTGFIQNKKNPGFLRG